MPYTTTVPFSIEPSEYRGRVVHSSRGFTLIELMVTIAVLAILMAMAAPSFNDFFQRYRLRGAADDVATLMAVARSEAVARNRNVAIVFSGTGAAWCVGAAVAAEPAAPGDLVTTAPTCNCSGDCRIADRVMESQGANYRGVTVAAVPASFVFNRLTGAVDPLGTTTTTLQSPNGHYSLAVSVSPLGRGRLCVPSGSPAMAGFQTC